MKALFSIDDIESIKRELGHLLPEVKSSHRVEAMARGLGWKTHAALLADLRSGPAVRAADHSAFAAYLKDHGFANANSCAFDEAVARVRLSPEQDAIKAVIQSNPDLATWGFGTLRDRTKSREERESEFQDARKKMLTPFSVDEFVRAREYLAQFGKRQTFNTRVSSYGLKHRAETFHRQRGTGNSCVANGMFIAAAIDLGFTAKRVGINALFNICSKPNGIDSPHRAAVVRNPHLPPLTRGARKVAWRNMMIAAINAGLDQSLFGLDANDNRWSGRQAIYRLTIAEAPAIASVQDIGFGKPAFDVVLKPRGDAEESIGAFVHPSFWSRAADAFATGWLERAKGKWLQEGSRCFFRRDVVPVVAAATVQPNGYAPTGRLML